MDFIMDTHRRSILKTISWRVVATLLTTGVTFVVTGRVDLAITVGLGDSIVKFFSYYLHERMWSKIRFGQVRPPEYQI
jgi:adenylylsulfate kinase